MPYNSIAAAKRAGFPTTAEGIPLTLAQINKLAEIYDAIKKAGTAKEPFAVAWSTWKKLYKKVGKKWVKRKPEPKAKSEEIREKKVEKRGEYYCVVHCSGSDIGKPLKGGCFSIAKYGETGAKNRALAMHRAIMVSKYKDVENSKIVSDLEILSKEASDLVVANGEACSFTWDSVVERTVECLVEIAKRNRENKASIILHPQDYEDGSPARMLWDKVKPYLMQSEIAALMLPYDEYKEFETAIKTYHEEKQRVLSTEDYDALLKETDYTNKALPDKYYLNHKEGDFWSQVHIAGITPSEYKDYKDGKIPLWRTFVNHPMHIDVRAKFETDDLMQFVIQEKSVNAYLKVLEGEVDSKTKRVAKGLVVVKSSEENKDTILTPTAAKKIAKYIIEDKSQWIGSGEAGASTNGWGFLGTIVTGEISTGVMRPDFREIFLTPDETLPSKNKSLLSGKWILKALNEPEHFWMTFKATKDTLPANPYEKVDSGDYQLLPASELKRFSKEEYPEYSSRIELFK